MTTNQLVKRRFFYGYIVVIASVFIMIITYGAGYSFGVFFKPVQNEFGWSRAATSGAYSLNMLLFGLSGIVAGRLSDRFGPRLVVTLCGLMVGLGYLLMSRVNAIWQLYLLYGVLVGIGIGSFVPILSAVARWFTRTRALMSGIVMSGIGLGTVIMPPLANHLISNYSWRTSYAVVGAMALVISVLAAQFVRSPTSSPGINETRQASPDQQTSDRSLKQAVITRQFWAIFIAFFFLGVSLHTVMVHIVPHATDIGITPAEAATILSVIGLGSVIAKISLGGVVDRWGNKPVLVIVIIMMLAAFLWLQVAGQLWMLYLFGVVFAIAYGGFAAVESPIVAEYFGLKSHGTIFGIIVFAVTTGGAIGPLIAGRIFDITGSYLIAFWINAGINLISLVVCRLLTPLSGKVAILPRPA